MLQMRVRVHSQFVSGDVLVHTCDALFNYAQSLADNALSFFEGADFFPYLADLLFQAGSYFADLFPPTSTVYFVN